MHLPMYQIPPEKERELTDQLHVFNFSDVDLYTKSAGKTYCVRKGTVRELPASICYRTFGDPNLRKYGNATEAQRWEREVNRVKHRYFIGNETDSSQLFFTRYLLAGKIGCQEILRRFVETEKIQLDLEQDPQTRLTHIAHLFYGKAVGEPDPVSHGGRSARAEDLALFSKFHLADTDEVKEMSQEEVMDFSAAMFGTKCAPSTPGGSFSGTWDEARANPETAAQTHMVVIK